MVVALSGIGRQAVTCRLDLVRRGCASNSITSSLPKVRPPRSDIDLTRARTDCFRRDKVSAFVGRSPRLALISADCPQHRTGQYHDWCGAHVVLERR
jgi:hypothetical protein